MEGETKPRIAGIPDSSVAVAERLSTMINIVPQLQPLRVYGSRSMSRNIFLGRKQTIH
jgi:hypothetical protein